jgi:hypothetical protein
VLKTYDFMLNEDLQEVGGQKKKRKIEIRTMLIIEAARQQNHQ